MWPFKKKEIKKVDPLDPGDDEEEEEEKHDDEGLANKVEMMQASLTKINGTLDSMKEMRKSTSERFATINEQMGELRGQVTDVQRTVGMIEVKATKAADLVESVHPDRLMIQVQKEDGKIEGLRGILEAKEEMMRNIMDQLRKIRDQINVFRGIEQVIKLNEEVKDELMSVKRIVASVERHADRVDNVFIEAQKSFQAFNTFADKLDSLKVEMKELQAKADKTEVSVQASVKKADFDEKMAIVERYDKRAKKILADIEEYYLKLDEKLKNVTAKARGEFNAKIEKAEIMSKAFEDLLRENPILAKDLKVSDYLKKHLDDSGAAKASASEEVKSAPAEGGDKPDEKLTEGMEKVKK